MSENSFISSIKEDALSAYKVVFGKNWPTWLSGIFIAIIALMFFLWQGPLGIAGGYKNWGDWIYYAVGIDKTKPTAPWMHTMSITNFGLFFGAFISALLSRQFKIRKTSWLEYVKGLVGGMLMGIGAAFAGGCNVGGFYSAIGLLSIGGYAMMVGLGLGAYLGLRYLMWEMEHIQVKAPAPEEPKQGGVDWMQIEPWFGWLFLLGGVVAFYIYSLFEQTQMGGLLFLGILLGVSMHRARFCFVRAFRCPFMTGESEMVKVIALSLMIYGLGTAIIKWNYLQPEMMGVYHPFWIGSLVGGTIFGVGMLLAGGCATSTLWRLGEGHTKLGLALLGFILSNPMTALFLKESGLDPLLGKGIFLPKVVTWYFAPVVFILILLAWVLWARWNEKTEKFVIS